jgi:hypothetical protein
VVLPAENSGDRLLCRLCERDEPVDFVA